MSLVVLRGDAAHIPLPDDSVDLIVTSPPYWSLRSYTDDGGHYGGQLGDEATPGEYLDALIGCTREWMRVVKPAGSIWVNLGDKYATRWSSRSEGNGLHHDRGRDARGGRNTTGSREKSLLALPWRYAIRAVDELGLVLRAEVVWSKLNGLPESVTDRVRRSHEQLFHFTRSPHYYSAIDEIREAHQPQSIARAGRNRFTPDRSQDGTANTPNRLDPDDACNPLGRLPGSVWPIATQPLTLPEWLGIEHHAAFPMELPRRLILGWSPAEVCGSCGEGRRPVTSLTGELGRRPGGITRQAKRTYAGLSDAALRVRAISGYACRCAPRRPAWAPGVVLDPFGGTGTTALLADVLDRTGITIDRSADYCRAARWRTTDPGQRAAAMQVPRPPLEVDGQDELWPA